MKNNMFYSCLFPCPNPLLTLTPFGGKGKGKGTKNKNKKIEKTLKMV
jgi:hypothetical protein